MEISIVERFKRTESRYFSCAHRVRKIEKWSNEVNSELLSLRVAAENLRNELKQLKGFLNDSKREQ